MIEAVCRENMKVDVMADQYEKEYNDLIKKKEIKIEENCLDSLENFQLSSFYNLKKLRIKKNCLKKLLCFCIQECNQLVNVSLIGKEMTDDELDRQYEEIKRQREERRKRRKEKDFEM